MFSKSEVIMMITVIATTVLLIAGYVEYRVVYDMSQRSCREEARIEARKIYNDISEELSRVRGQMGR